MQPQIEKFCELSLESKYLSHLIVTRMNAVKFRAEVVLDADSLTNHLLLKN